MTTVQEIEKALVKLPPGELSEFRKWFEKFDAEDWDRQFESDAMSGKLDVIAEKAISDFQSGNFKKL